MHQQAARTLRRNQTDAEQKLWRYLRNRQLAGYKFRRQVPIKPYIVDFLCRPRSLVIELDGSQQQVEYDQARTNYLEAHGFKVVRFWNNEVLTQTESVLEAILLSLAQQEKYPKKVPLHAQEPTSPPDSNPTTAAPVARPYGAD